MLLLVIVTRAYIFSPKEGMRLFFLGIETIFGSFLRVMVIISKVFTNHLDTLLRFEAAIAALNLFCLFDKFSLDYFMNCM